VRHHGHASCNRASTDFLWGAVSEPNADGRRLGEVHVGQACEVGNVAVVNTGRFEDFYAAAWPRAVRLAHLLTGLSSAAEDLAQEAFTQMSKRWSTIEHPPAYLRVALVHASQSWHRTRQRETAGLQRATAGDTGAAALESNELRDSSSRCPTGSDR
jgi:hypothetical protein